MGGRVPVPGPRQRGMAELAAQAIRPGANRLGANGIHFTSAVGRLTPMTCPGTRVVPASHLTCGEADTQTGQQFGAGKSSYSSSDVKPLDGRAAYLWALGGESEWPYVTSDRWTAG